MPGLPDERGGTMAKSRKKTDAVAVAADTPTKSPSQPALVTESDIARRAHALYLARGCEHGRDVDDWLQAESDLKRTLVSPAAR